ncbi:MAG TPA: hypothetical protein VFS39_07635 [Nitrospira sp.]|nr:hypothetical protein [Nitrospira sp.]
MAERQSPSRKSHPLSLTDEETALVADADFFRKKARISVKIKGMLDATHAALVEEMDRSTLLRPPGFDPSRCQFVKGEHLESFPYQYLDFPKHFQVDDKCTFRTLFWWGHHVVFAWILDGGLVKHYKKNLVDRYHTVAGQGLELCIAPTLWEWKRGEGYTLPISHDRKATVAAVLAERRFIKIGRYIPLEDGRVRDGDLAGLARDGFRAMKPIVSA